MPREYASLIIFVKAEVTEKLMKPVIKTILILLFALAMGYMESAVVVYLRALYYPEGFAFPLKEMAQQLVITELFREAATLIMLAIIGSIAATVRLHRFAWFLVAFGTWDIAYYIFLKLLIGWPGSLLSDDILFLLPTLWTGPVAAPVINSVTMILLATVILWGRKGSAPVNMLTVREWILLITGACIVLITYMKDFIGYVIAYKHSPAGAELSWNNLMITLPAHFVPRGFDWLLFGLGVSLNLLAIILIFNRSAWVKSAPPSLTGGIDQSNDLIY